MFLDKSLVIGLSSISIWSGLYDVAKEAATGSESDNWRFHYHHIKSITESASLKLVANMWRSLQNYIRIKKAQWASRFTKQGQGSIFRWSNLIACMPPSDFRLLSNLIKAKIILKENNLLQRQIEIFR